MNFENPKITSVEQDTKEQNSQAEEESQEQKEKETVSLDNIAGYYDENSRSVSKEMREEKDPDERHNLFEIHEKYEKTYINC